MTRQQIIDKVAIEITMIKTNFNSWVESLDLSPVWSNFMVLVTLRIDGTDVVSTIIPVGKFTEVVTDKLFFEIFKEWRVVWIVGDDGKIGDKDGPLEGDDVVGKSVALKKIQDGTIHHIWFPKIIWLWEIET